VVVCASARGGRAICASVDLTGALVGALEGAALWHSARRSRPWWFVIMLLFEHCTRPQFQVRFRWRPHSVTFWDNRSVQHMALWDYYPQVRSGRRVTIKGDRPF